MIETLGDILRNNAYKFPNETAYVFGDHRISFGDHHARAARLASGLYKLGLRRQDRVSILAQNAMEYMETYGACALTGFIAATVNFRLAPPEMAYILADA